MQELLPWQLNLLDKLDGAKPGELIVMMAGRRAGKSVLSSKAFQRLWDDIYKERPVEDLVLTDGAVDGEKYYCIEPVGGSWTEMSTWCKTTFGEPGEVWDIGKDSEFMWPERGRWYMNNRKFWFRNERDRDWFIVKWRA